MKKLISTFLCICFLLFSLSGYAMAVHTKSLVITETIEDSWIVDVKGDKASDISDTSSLRYYRPDDGYDNHYDAFSQLDLAQKIIYTAIISNPGVLRLNIEFPDGVFEYSNFTQEYFTELMDAVCTDCPEIFYYAGYSIGGGYLYNNGNYIQSITYNVGVYDTSLYTAGNLSGYYNSLIEAVENVPVDLSNRYNFILSLHDYLADTVYYPDLNSSDYVMSAHDAYGALVEGRAVCQGYSDAVKLVCDYYNIPAVCIAGTADGGGHMWNAVQMEDGKWYLMDITWDDQGSYGTYYDFFLVGTDSRNTYFGGQKFSAQHINDPNLCLPNLHYSATAYDRTQDMFTLFKGTYNSRFDENNRLLCLSVFDFKSTDVYFNGISTGITPDHGASFEIVDGSGNSIEYTVVIVGDPDGDGNLTRSDYNFALDMAVGNDRNADSSDSAACDVNGDGYVDALDLALLHNGESGLTNKYNLE